MVIKSSQDWKKIKLKDIITIMHGRDQKKIIAKNGLYPILGSGGEIGRTNSYLYNRPSVLIGRKGTINHPMFMETPFWTIDTLFYSKISESVFPKFVFYLFCIIDWLSINESSGRPSLTSQNIENIEVKIPFSIEEQKKIANQLFETDNLINSLESIIQKKKNIKQGVMQELLTGKRRLEGFSEEWNTKKIIDFTDVTSGGTPSTLIKEYWNGDIWWMNSGELNLKKVFDVEGRITQLGLKKSATKLIPKNCILIGLAGQGKTRGTVAMNYVELCINQSIGAIQPNESFNPEFLYYNLDLRYEELRKISSGGEGRGGLNLTLLRNISVYLPSNKKEQDAIVKILSDMDSEIQQLEKQLEKYTNLRQAMMQKLLTGEIRLV